MLKNRLTRFFNSIIGHFTLAAILSLCLLIAGVLYDGNRTLNTALIENTRASANQTSQILNLTVSTYASTDDLETVKAFFSEMLEADAENGLVYVIIGGADGRQLINTLEPNIPIPNPDNLDTLSTASVQSGLVHIRNPLLLPHKEIGFLQYGLSIKNLVDATRREQKNSLIRTGCILLATLIAILMLGLRISLRLREMIRASKEIISGQYDQTVKISGQDELANLGEYFNHMSQEVKKKIGEITELNLTLENRVMSRTLELEKANQLLEENFKNLKATQEKLVSAEKLAALGSLVAGVAHELNTPIGNALTVATTLSHNTSEVSEIYRQDQLKKSILEKHFQSLEEASNLLIGSITRASELIVSFKTIAVDQTSELRRHFNLRQLLSELERTLKLQSKIKKVELTLDMPDDIELDSYPGPFTQVVMNLYNNAVVHAFEGMDNGKLTISATTIAYQPNQIHLTFTDNGNGISKENLSKIFDPFFTTKLGHGGSGLGLHICYNIVHNVLGGTIEVSSILAVGTSFDIVIPCIAPTKLPVSEYAPIS